MAGNGSFLTLVLAALASTGVHAQSIPLSIPAPQDPAPLLSENPPPAKVAGDFTLGVVGDLLYTKPSVDPADPELEAIFNILREADFAVGNQEGPMAAMSAPGMSPVGNGMLLMEPGVAEDFKAGGIDMVSLANNHLTDWGEAGVRETIRHLDAAGIVHAGGGTTLVEAQAPAIASHPKAKIAMVATASTFNPSAMANDSIEGMPARAGISVLRTKRITLVSEAEMASLRSIATRIAFGRRAAPSPTTRELSLGEETYRVSDKPRGVTYEVNPYDRYALLAAVHAAKAKADLVIFTIHAHESATGMDDDNPEPADFLPTLFHEAVNAGADVIVGGGPHATRGIEIYKGRPIFYGVGTFFITADIFASQELQQDIKGARPSELRQMLPTTIARAKGGNPRTWYESAIAVIDYKDRHASRVKLIPLDLRPDDESATRGLPRIAKGPRAREILERIQNDSTRFGTKVRIDGDVGFIDIR